MEPDECRRAHRQLMRDAYAQVALWVELATAGFADLSSNGGTDLRSYAMTQAAVKEQCRFPTWRMGGVLRAARDLNEHPSDRARRAELVGLWTSWARSVGAEHWVRALRRSMRTCADFREQVRASYRVHMEPGGAGKDASVHIRVENGLDHQANLLLTGTLVAHGVLPRVPAPGRVPRDRSVVWGTLHDDQHELGPHATQTFPQNLTPNKQYLRLTSTGVLSRIRPLAYARDNETSRGCALPVPRED